MHAPLRIGLTGGIASGKSTVANLFAALGIAVIDTDVIAREVVGPGRAALDEIRAEFGAGVFGADGLLDRSAMRRHVFADAAARHRLEAILHPRIERETMRRLATASGDYVLVVVPLLTESPLKDQLDRILVVDCDEATQISRLLARDAESEEQARRMLASQASRKQRLAIADDIIRNDSDLDSLTAQVSALHDTYKALANLPAS